MLCLKTKPPPKPGAAGSCSALRSMSRRGAGWGNTIRLRRNPGSPCDGRGKRPTNIISDLSRIAALIRKVARHPVLGGGVTATSRRTRKLAWQRAVLARAFDQLGLNCHVRAPRDRETSVPTLVGDDEISEVSQGAAGPWVLRAGCADCLHFEVISNRLTERLSLWP